MPRHRDRHPENINLKVSCRRKPDTSNQSDESTQTFVGIEECTDQDSELTQNDLASARLLHYTKHQHLPSKFLHENKPNPVAHKKPELIDTSISEMNFFDSNFGAQTARSSDKAPHFMK